MNIVKQNSFELSFIAALSASGGFLFSTLFGLNFFSAVGVALVLVAVFSAFYLAVTLFLGKNKEEIKTEKLTPAPRREKFEFVAIETNNKAVKIAPQQFVKPEKVIERIKEVKKTPLESFKENPIGELEQTRDLIISLLEKTQNSYGRIERIFGERMHKNTKTDIQSFLYLKQLNESLSKRLEQVIDLLDEVEKDNKLSLKKSFELAYGPLSLPQDSFNAVISESSCEVPPLAKEEWEIAIQSTLKKLSRKKTFHHALNYAMYN
jgi:uncharacterized membrane protein YciS (DUF1049 family)